MSTTGFPYLPQEDVVAAAWHVLAGARSRGPGTPLRLRSGPPVRESRRTVVPFAPVPRLP